MQSQQSTYVMVHQSLGNFTNASKELCDSLVKTADFEATFTNNRFGEMIDGGSKVA
jgi:hypothetical protein